MTTPTRKLATTLIAWVMVATPFIAFVPNAAAHTTLPTSGTFTLDVDFSGDREDDYWRTTPVEWGMVDVDLELRHINGPAIGLDDIGDDYDEDDIESDLILCSPSGVEAETLSANDMEVESDEEDEENVDVYDAADGDLEDPTAADFYLDMEPFFGGLFDAVNGDDDDDTEDVPDADDLDDNDDGKVSSTELQDQVDDGDVAGLVTPAARGIFEEVTFDEFGIWWVVVDDLSATPCGLDSIAGGGDADGQVEFAEVDSDVITGFLVEAATVLEVSVNPTTLTFAYDDDADNPEPEDLDISVTVEWGGDAMENAEVTLWACDRARPASWFCDDDDRIDESDDLTTEDPTPIEGTNGQDLNDDGDYADAGENDLTIDNTGGDGTTDFDDDFPGAGTYLISASCIVQNEDDEYLVDPEEIDEATHECVDPADIVVDDADTVFENAVDFDYNADDFVDANEGLAQLRGNTTLTIAPGELEVELARGGDAVEGRLSEVVWKITYAGSDALVLADNTHGDEGALTADNDFANADANWTLDITLPTGKHVLLNYDAESADEDGNVWVGAEVDDEDGILQCSGESQAECDLADSGDAGTSVFDEWELVEADEVTECDQWAGDGQDCPTYDVDGIIDEEGDVDVITGPEDEDDVATGLDPRVYRVGDDGADGEDEDWGVYLRSNPEFDEDLPDSSEFLIFDDLENGDFEDEDFRLGWLSVYVPWASGTYEFELRVNHFSDSHPEFVGSWTLNVGAAPEFGFYDVEPTFQLEVPARTGAPDDTPDDWVYDPIEDVDAEFDEDIEDDDEEVFSYVLAFTIQDDEQNHVNAFPCQGDDNDGDEIDADGEVADYPAALALGTDDDVDPSGDNIVFWPVDGDDRDCPEFDFDDDLTVTGDLLYEIEEDWIQELFMEPGDDALDACLAGATQGVDDIEGSLVAPGGFADAVYEDQVDLFGFEAADDPLAAEVEDMNTLIPLYCIYNVVPASPVPVIINAMIDGEAFILEFNVTEGVLSRVTQVSANAETDGTIRVTVTDADGGALSGEMTLFSRGDAPEDSDNEVIDDDGDVITGSGGVFTLSEDDEIEAGEYAVYVRVDGEDEGTFDYGFARVNVEPTSDLDVDVSPSRVTAGVETMFSLNVTTPDDVDSTTFEAFFLTAYDFARVQRDGVNYVDALRFREDQDGFDDAGDKFDFDFDTGDNEEELSLKAEGPYHVYVRDTDGNHDNNGTMPTVEVVPPVVTFTPGRIAFALAEDVEVEVTVKDADGEALEGTLRVAYDPDNDVYDSDDYGFAIFSGADVDSGGSEDDEEFGGFVAGDDPDDFGDAEDWPWSYLEYMDAAYDDALPDTLPEITVDEEGSEFETTVEDIGPVQWVFMPDGSDIFVNTTGILDLVPPAITVTPDRLTAGVGADVSVNVKDLNGDAVPDLLVALCGTPLTTSTTCTGVVATDDAGNAVVSVFPAGTGQIEVWIHEGVEGDEAGECDISVEDMARINPITGAALTENDVDSLDDDCDPATAGTNDEYQFEDTGIVLQVVATQSLLRVTVPDTVQVGAPTNIAVSRGAASGAQTPVSGAAVTITGPTGASVFTGTTDAAGQVAFTPAAAGAYTVKATSAGFQDGTATFTAQVDEVVPSGAFEIVSFTIDPASVQVGQTVEGRATVRNTGAASGTATVLLMVDGAQRASQSVTLGPGESLPVSFDFTPSVAKTSKLAVKVDTVMSPEQTLTVTPRPSGDGTDGDDGEEAPPTVPGFEAVFALAAIGVALAVLGRRKK